MSSPSVDADGRSGSWASPRVALGVLIGLAVPLVFLKLGAAALVDPDEGYYAAPALEMLRSGSWAVPVFRGQPWFDKPVLFYWAILAAYKTFGVSEWAARLGSALAGLGGAVAVATLAPAGLRRRGAHLLAAIVLLTSLEYAYLSRAAVTDMMLTLFVALGLLAAARHLETGGLGSAFVSGTCLGLAVLTKGPVGALVPGLALAAYGFTTRRRAWLAPRPLLLAAAGFLTTSAPWYLYMLATHRDLVMSVFLGQENLGRFVHAEHNQFPFFYVAVLAGGLLPWSAALPSALWRAMAAVLCGDERAASFAGPGFALSWFLAVLLVFSLCASKLVSYVLPAFPAAAFLIADYWCGALAPTGGASRAARGPVAVAWTGAAFAIAAAAGLAAATRDGRWAISGIAVYGIGALVVASALAAVAAVRRRKLALFAAFQSASSVALVLGAIVFLLPGLEAEDSTKSLVRRLEAAGLADEIAGTYRVPDASLDFYMSRPLHRTSDAADLGRLVADEPRRLWIVRATETDALTAEGRFSVEPIMTVARRAVVRLSPKPVPR